MVRLKNFVQCIVITQHMLKPGYSMAGKPGADSVTPVHERCREAFGSLYERLIQEPCTEGVEGVAVLAKLYMVLHPLSHPMVPCLEGPLRLMRTSLRRTWREEATGCQFLTCLARGLEKAATLFEGRAKRRQRERKQSQGADDIVMMKSVLMTHHKADSGEGDREPATQKELGRLAGGDTPWKQYRVSRALKGIFGTSPMRTYNRLFKTETLSGFLKKTDSSRDFEDIEAPRCRPHHPTEREERRSQNT